MSTLLKAPARLLPFSYELVRSARRRSLGIEIRRAQVIVRAPYFVALKDVERFVQEKSHWVEQALQRQSAQLASAQTLSFADGSQVPFLGEQLEVGYVQAGRAGVVRLGDRLEVTLGSRSRLSDEDQAKRLVAGWYYAQAHVCLLDKTHWAADQLGVVHAGVTLKATRSKWGHCTAQGAIQYNWQIMLAPEPVVDYLVAHEVSHLIHHNHSKAFWSVVESLCPDYKQQRAWLKANGMQLMF